MTPDTRPLPRFFRRLARYLLALALGLGLALAGPAAAQDSPGEGAAVSPREIQDLNTIATLSVGLVIQAFGYIGTYADLLSRDVYEAQLVTQMLGDTVRYLRNALVQLRLYQDASLDVSRGDRQYLAEITEILVLLIEEAESLSAFAQTHAESDLQNYKDARDKAWSLISDTVGN
ncbi:MAG: hypothetical protein LBO66_03015 [Deltaproteobacteria bacterium]|jgi:hypothetical protein|nr:hypothetical protein [Deltaproteobacteria bacterium]